MNVYIPRYEPELDINIFIKPSVIDIQILMEIKYVTHSVRTMAVTRLKNTVLQDVI